MDERGRVSDVEQLALVEVSKRDCFERRREWRARFAKWAEWRGVGEWRPDAGRNGARKRVGAAVARAGGAETADITKAEPITLPDKDVEFRVTADHMEIRKKFALKEMEFQGTLAL